MTRPKVTTFYSFKGGLGRTFALVNVAVQWARQGHRVLAVDMDLEAPGLGMWLPPSDGDWTSHAGLIDLVEAAIDRGRIPEDLSTYVYEARVSRSIDEGRILCMGAGRLDAAYARQLRSLNWERFFVELDGRAFFDEVLAALADAYAVDRVLIDARTGFSDPGSIAVRVLPDLVALFFRPDEQNLVGLEMVLGDIRADRRGAPDPGVHYLLVASQLVPEPPWSAAGPDTVETRLAEAALRLRILGGTEDEPDRRDYADVADTRIVRLYWKEQLARALQPVVSPRGTSPLADDYERLSERIDEQLGRIGWQREVAPSPPSGAAGLGRRVLDANLGKWDGSRDPMLDAAFVRTRAVDRILRPATTLVSGNKGSGKSALFRWLYNAGIGGAEVVPVHGEVQSLPNATKEDLPPPGSDEGAFQRFWTAYLGVRLEAWARGGRESLLSMDLAELRHRLRQWQEPGSDLRFDAVVRGAVARAEPGALVVLVDATERLFEGRELDQARSFLGIGRMVLQWRSPHPGLRFKVFVRDHALLTSEGTLVDRSHLEGDLVDLHWDEAETWWFVLRRLLRGTSDEDAALLNTSSELLEQVRSVPRPPTGEENLTKLRGLIERVFPEAVYSGENEAPFHRWLTSRIVDGHGNLYPRVLLGFLERCQSRQKARSREGLPVFERDVVRDAFVEASKRHADAWFDELGYLRSYLDVFSDTGVFHHSQTRYTRAAIDDAFARVHDRHQMSVVPETALKTLVRLGMLVEAPGSSWRGERYDYELPRVYKYVLAKSPKGRV